MNNTETMTALEVAAATMRRARAERDRLIKDARRQGITQAKIAEAIGLTTQGVRFIERRPDTDDA